MFSCLGMNLQEEIKTHPFFRNINWEMLVEKKIEPPYNPNVVSEKYWDVLITLNGLV